MFDYLQKYDNMTYFCIKFGVTRTKCSGIGERYDKKKPLNSYNLRNIQEFLGHKSVETIMVYTHVVANINQNRVMSPLDI